MPPPLKTGPLPPTLPRENTGRENLEEWVLEGCFGRRGWVGA
mgnify:CR=1 FL=1